MGSGNFAMASNNFLPRTGELCVDLVASDNNNNRENERQTDRQTKQTGEGEKYYQLS